jgi:hypothetical protein
MKLIVMADPTDSIDPASETFLVIQDSGQWILSVIHFHQKPLGPILVISHCQG